MVTGPDYIRTMRTLDTARPRADIAPSIRNVVCVNLAGNVVFFVRGIRPRTWWEKEKAKRAMVIYVLVWLVTLIILLFSMYVRWALTVKQ